MDTLIDTYTRLTYELKELSKAKCFCLQSGLEKMESYWDAERYREIGIYKTPWANIDTIDAETKQEEVNIYDPNKTVPSFARRNADELSLRMLETTSQLRLLYQLIEKEDEEAANKLKKTNDSVDMIHSHLERSVTNTMKYAVRDN